MPPPHKPSVPHHPLSSIRLSGRFQPSSSVGPQALAQGLAPRDMQETFELKDMEGLAYLQPGTEESEGVIALLNIKTKGCGSGALGREEIWCASVGFLLSTGGWGAFRSFKEAHGAVEREQAVRRTGLG